MLFNSLHFFIFFPLVAIIYFLLPYRYRWFFLLAVSCYFYMVFVPAYILILAATIVIDYIAGIYIENSKGKRRKLYLIISIISNVGFLAFFKYFNFLAINLTDFSRLIHWNYSVPLLNIILPIGLSFHTFQAMSYTIEVYRGNQKAERNFGIYALYVMFFPQLVAGPIERPQHLLHQFYEQHDFDYKRIVNGLRLIAWGLFKKVIIADRLALVVNQVYNHAHTYSGPSLIMATIFFTYQLYCDFSGYTDIARGSAEVLGFRLMENFKLPYYAKSIPEFWRRWHISLFSWFRDYVYTPMAYKLRGYGRTGIYFGLMVTFLISGLWHGANWTYVFWGALHGCYLILSAVTSKLRSKIVKLFRLNLVPKLHGLIQVLSTLLLWIISLVLFRANSLNDAIYIYKHMFVGVGVFIKNLSPASFNQLASLGVDFQKPEILIGIVAVIILEIVQWLARNQTVPELVDKAPWWIRWPAYYGLMLAFLLYGFFGAAQFIYFQF